MNTIKVLRVELLDVIRGIAASLVVIHHVLRCTPGLDSGDFWKSSLATQGWVNFIFLGGFAVTVFFVLSGTSLAISALNNEGKPTCNIKSFYIKRFFRIYPLYFLVILVYFSIRPIFYTISPIDANDWLSPQFYDNVTVTHWITYLSMTFNWVCLSRVFNNALWSLPIEVQFYLFFPLLIYIFNKGGNIYGSLYVMIFSIVVFILGIVLKVPGGTFKRLWEFSGGLLLGVNLYYLSSYLKSNKLRVLLIIMIVILFTLSRYNIPLYRLPSNLIEVLCAFCIVTIGISFSRWKQKSIASKILVYVGTISYGLYLWHIMFLALFAPLVKYFKLPQGLHFILLLFIVFSLAVIFSGFIYGKFEYPLIKIGKNLVKKYY